MYPSMNSPSSNQQKEQKATLPPRRGQIKAQIFESFVETVSSVASKAREALSKLKGAGNNDGGVGSPASASPPSPSPGASPAP